MPLVFILRVMRMYVLVCCISMNPHTVTAAVTQCPQTCFGQTCEYYSTSCDELENTYGCDCSGCTKCICDPTGKNFALWWEGIFGSESLVDDVCDCSTISCNSNNQPYWIDADGYSMYGTVPSSIGSLSSLQYLYLYSNPCFVLRYRRMFSGISSPSNG